MKHILETSYPQLSGFTRLWERFRLLFLTRTASLFAALMLANIFAYLYHMVMARMMTPADYGNLVTLMSVSYVLDVVLRSVQAWLTKTVSDVKETGAGRLSAIFMLAMRRLVLLAVVIFTVQAIASRWIANFLQMDIVFPVVMLGLYAALHFIVPVPRGILLGVGRIRSFSATIVIEPVVRLIAGVIFVWFGFKVNGAMGGYAVGSLLCFALGLFLIRPVLTADGATNDSTAHLEGIDRYAMLVLITNICLMLMASIDQIFIKVYFSPEIAGNYAVTFVLGRVILMTAISLGIAIFTRSTSMVDAEPRRGIVLAKGLLVMGGIAGVSTAVALAVPSVIVGFMAGSQYVIAATYLGLVGVEMTLFSLVYIQSYYHLSIGNVQILWPLCIAILFEVILLLNFHNSVQQVLACLIFVMSALLLCVSVLSVLSLRKTRQPETPINAKNE